MSFIVFIVDIHPSKRVFTDNDSTEQPSTHQWIYVSSVLNLYAIVACYRTGNSVQQTLDTIGLPQFVKETNINIK